MDSLLENFDGGEDVNEALQNISDETIEKVFAGKVALTTIISCQRWPNSFFGPIKAYHLDGSDITEQVAGMFGF